MITSTKVKDQPYSFPVAMSRRLGTSANWVLLNLDDYFAAALDGERALIENIPVNIRPVSRSLAPLIIILLALAAILLMTQRQSGGAAEFATLPLCNFATLPPASF